MPKKFIKTEKGGDEEYLADTPSTSSTGAIAARRRHSATEQMPTKKRNAKKGKDKAKTNVHGELKGLQDSLSHFFTPNGMRQSRAASFKIPLEEPLEITIDNSLPHKMISSNESRKSSIKTENSSSHISPKSPYRRDQLQDALSGFFTPDPHKRRVHKEGEYRQMSRGEPSKNNEDEIENDHPIEAEVPRAITPRQLKGAPKAEKSMANDTGANNSIAVPQKRVLKRRENAAAAFKSAKLIKRAYHGTRDSRKKMTQPVSSGLKLTNGPTSIKNTIKDYFRPLKAPTTRVPATNNKSEVSIYSPDISEEDRAIFEEARKVIKKDLDSANNALKHDADAIFPAKIRIHCYEITTWYSSPYPQEYAYLPLLHICDACLMYLSVPSSHFRKCKQQYPPGNEIYRDAHFSVFEVDGNQARVYCRNLCLLAKLFIDHKTLYFDVEPFLFYVLTMNDESGCHFVGYFSKEKFSACKYNLACIMTLPCYQGRGFGRFLIDFSYLLSRREGLVGSPERPLSDLGRVAYQSYWLSAILEYFHQCLQTGNIRIEQIALKDISSCTGIAACDIAETLAENLMFATRDSKTSIVLDEATIHAHWKRAKQSARRIWLDEGRLQWTPKIYSPSKEFRVRSPTFTPLPSPIKADEKMEEDIAPRTTASQKKNKKSAVRKLPLANSPKPKPVEKIVRTPKMPAGKVGRKKPPGKKEHEEQHSSNNTDAKESAGNKSKKRASCKDGPEKWRKRQQPPSSSDDDDEAEQPKSKLTSLTRLLTLNSVPSTSNASNSRQLRKTASASRKCTISRAKGKSEKNSSMESCSTSDAEEGSEMKSIKRSGGYGKSIGAGRKENRMEPQTDNSASSISNGEEPKRRKIFKKRRALKRPSPGSRSTTSSSSSSSNTSRATSARGGSVVSVKEEEEEKHSNDLANRLMSKKRRKSFQQRTQSSLEEEEGEGEEEDRSLLCSSASPQPNGGDRLPIFKAPTKGEIPMINIGGEPETINMGGEPDEEDNYSSSNSFSTVASYKAPIIIQEGAAPGEAEGYELDDPPIVEHKKKKLRHQEGGGQLKNVSQMATAGQQQVNNIGIISANVVLQQSTANPPRQQQTTLKIPTIYLDPRHHKSSCSPSDVTATVEMPALDAAERHISPAGSQARFEEEEPAEDDEAPPKLSPQAENLSSAANATTPAAIVQIADLSMAGSSTNDDSFKTNESQQTITLAEEQPQNTSSSSTELNASAEQQKCSQPPQPPPPKCAAPTETLEISPPLPQSSQADYQQSAQNLPQIRVRSESNVEFCTQPPAINKLQRSRKSSFSGHANNEPIQEQQQQNVQMNIPAVSLPVISQTAAQNVLQQQQSNPPSQHFPQQYAQQIGGGTSPFISPPFNPYEMLQTQQHQLLPASQQLPPSRSVDKKEETGGKKTKEKAVKSSHHKNTSKSPQKPNNSNKGPSQNIVAIPSSSTAAAAAAPASAALQAQWAQQFAQYCHHQYPYQTGAGNAAAIAAQQQQQQQMNAAAAAAYAPYAIYNQAQAWQAWHMAAAKQFQQNPATAAAYQNLPYDFQWMVGGTPGAPTSGGSLPPGAHPWPANFNHPSRHPSAAASAQSQHNGGGGTFYQSPHHPPM